MLAISIDSFALSVNDAKRSSLSKDTFCLLAIAIGFAVVPSAVPTSQLEVLIAYTFAPFRLPESVACVSFNEYMSKYTLTMSARRMLWRAFSLLSTEILVKTTSLSTSYSPFVTEVSDS